MSLELPFGIKPTNPTAVDAWAGPYASVAAANAAIPLEVRYQGQEVIIIQGGKSVKYVYATGTSNASLVPAQASPEAAAKTGNVISFAEPAVYGYASGAISGAITYDFTNAKPGTKVIIRHRDSTPLALPAGTIIQEGSYEVGAENLITLTLQNSTPGNETVVTILRAVEIITTYYVRPAGTIYGNGTGTSYENAWSGNDGIDWTKLGAGKTLVGDGTWNESLVVGASGENDNELIIKSYQNNSWNINGSGVIDNAIICGDFIDIIFDNINCENIIDIPVLFTSSGNRRIINSTMLTNFSFLLELFYTNGNQSNQWSDDLSWDDGFGGNRIPQKPLNDMASFLLEASNDDIIVNYPLSQLAVFNIYENYTGQIYFQLT